MHLGGPGIAQHAHDGLVRGAAHDRVVDHDEALAAHVVVQRVELAAHADVALRLVRGDEGAADVAVLHQALPVGNARALRVTLRGGHAGLGHAHHHVGVDGRLLGQQLAHATTGAVHFAAVELGVGPGEVHELDEAQLGVDALGRERTQRANAGGVDHDHLARIDFAHEVGADDVERG